MLKMLYDFSLSREWDSKKSYWQIFLPMGGRKVTAAVSKTRLYFLISFTSPRESRNICFSPRGTPADSGGGVPDTLSRSSCLITCDMIILTAFLYCCSLFFSLICTLYISFKFFLLVTHVRLNGCKPAAGGLIN